MRFHVSGCIRDLSDVLCTGTLSHSSDTGRKTYQQGNVLHMIQATECIHQSLNNTSTQKSKHKGAQDVEEIHRKQGKPAPVAPGASFYLQE